MSVDACLVRVTVLELKTLQDDPESLDTFMEELRERSPFPNPQLSDSVDRVLYVDGFTLSLLTDLQSEETRLAPLNAALWFAPHILDGAQYGAGDVTFHAAEEVTRIANELSHISESDLRALFEQHAAEFRLAATGYLENDEAILEYQAAHFRRVVTFFRDAANHGDAILLIGM